MSDVNIILEETPVFVQIAPAAQLNVSVASPPQVYINPVQSAPINMQMVTPPPIQLTVSPISGPPGIQGEKGDKGDTGQRGSLLLGMYGSQANLPTPSNDGLFVGDFAFDLDGNFYMIEET